MPINAQYAWEVCSEAATLGKQIRVVCDDGATFDGIVSYVDYDYLILAGKGFAHGQTEHLEILDD